jgi:hypothetical protein
LTFGERSARRSPQEWPSLLGSSGVVQPATEGAGGELAVEANRNSGCRIGKAADFERRCGQR